MQVLTSAIEGLIEFRPEPHRDARGFFSRTFDVEVVSAAGIDPTSFVQDSISRSRLGVVRGLHVRLGRGESKLVAAPPESSSTSSSISDLGPRASGNGSPSR